MDGRSWYRRRVLEEDFARWRDTLRDAIPHAVAALRARDGGGPLRVFALVSDADLRTVFAAGGTAAYLARLDSERVDAPEEWREHVDALAEVSRLQEAYADACYASEGALDPSADSKRPWKRAMVDAMGEVLAELRRDGLLDDEALILVWVPDASDPLFGWLLRASRFASGTKPFARWVTKLRLMRALSRTMSLLDRLRG
ncbi:MAG: DUF4303 domain-containing protein [Sandaracinus sp.]|nr:DUF4303 domain-containing protein [Sandaracinus sp.]